MQIKTKKRRWIIPIAIAALLVVGSVVVYGLLAHKQSWWPFSQYTKMTDTPKAENTINYSKPTDQEIKNSQNSKQTTTVDENKTPAVGDKTIPIGVSFSDVVDDKLEVRAFAPNVVEGGGVCTATLTKDSSTVVESSKAFIDSTTSQCRPIYIPVSKFNTKGVWSLVVSYTSSTGTGNSEAIEVNI